MELTSDWVLVEASRAGVAIHQCPPTLGLLYLGLTGRLGCWVGVVGCGAGLGDHGDLNKSPEMVS